MTNATSSVLGPDLAVRGNISATADLQIDGKVEGDITCASLVLGESGIILGAVQVQTARLAGTVKGSLEAGELVIEPTARIEADVTYEALMIVQGAQVDGKLIRKPTDEPRLAIAGGTEA